MRRELREQGAFVSFKQGQAGEGITGATPNQGRKLRGRMLGMAVAAATASLGASAFGQFATPVTVNGWLYNDIYPKTSGLTFAPSDANNNYTWYAAGSFAAGGLPTASSRTFTSASNSKTSFQFQPYNANNTLELTGNATGYFPGGQPVLTGSISLATPAAYSSFDLLNSDANGNTTVSYTMTFAGHPGQFGHIDRL